MVGDKRQGYVLLAVMVVDLVLVVGSRTMFEVNGNPSSPGAGPDQAVTSTQPGGNFEGKELRFGTPASALWAGVDDRHVERLGQLDARQLHAARRHDAAAPHAARRGEPRWRGRRA